MNTPRTDEVETARKFPASTEYYAMVVHARTLETELATERAHRNELSTLVKRLVREARRARPSDPLSYLAVDYLVRNKLHGEPMRTAMKEGAK